MQDSVDLRIRNNIRTYQTTVRQIGRPEPVLSAIMRVGLDGIYLIGHFKHDGGLIHLCR